MSAFCYHNQNVCLIENSSLVKQKTKIILYIDILYTNIHMLYICDKCLIIIVSKSTSEVTVKNLWPGESGEEERNLSDICFTTVLCLCASSRSGNT